MSWDWLDPIHGVGYQFWSGIGGAVALGLAAAVWSWARPERCSQLGCRRRAVTLHPQHGQPVCPRHLP